VEAMMMDESCQAVSRRWQSRGRELGLEKQNNLEHKKKQQSVVARAIGWWILSFSF
jgi:hypothetical protein